MSYLSADHTNTDEKVSIVTQFMEEIWQHRNFDELTRNNQSAHNAHFFQILGGNCNEADFIAIALGFQKHIEEIKYESIDNIVMDKKVVLEIKAHVKLFSILKPVEIMGMVSCYVEGNKIISGRNYFDTLPIFEALGLLPEDTINLCLSGAKLDVVM